MRGRFGCTAPTTLLRRNAARARAHLSRTPTPHGEHRDRSADGLDALAEGGMHVTLA
ncbi:hypothetical protein ACFC8N_32200 [Streptomyces sp. NPDC055966]|uniref:hypothetical protein n=1 Tax=Streptomyces sp. NPDC055966 TaxID=3345669 RepID=UPI001D20708B|nr:hypothetical protein [Streptomyces sp. tea 10]